MTLPCTRHRTSRIHVLWKICYDSHAGTVFPTRSIRYDGLRIYTLGKLKLPVLMRVVTRLAHSRAGVEVADIREENQLNPDHERAHWVLLPGNARKQYLDLVKSRRSWKKLPPNLLIIIWKG